MVGEILFLFIVLAIVAVVISGKSQSAGVISSAGKLLSSIIAIVVAPVKKASAS
jgi:hypothetical protein